MENVRKYVPDEQEQKIDLYAYWKIFWRKKYYFIVPLVLSVAISVAGVRRLTPIYESYTLLSIEDQNLFGRTMGRYITPADNRNRTRDRQYRTMIETRLHSRSFLDSLATRLNLQRSGRIREIIRSRPGAPGVSEDERVMRYIISMLRDKIGVQNTSEGLFTIGVTDSDPKTAHALATHVARFYIEVTQREQVQGLRQAGAFSDEQLAIYQEKLEAADRELSRVQRELAATDVETNPVNAGNLHIAEVRTNSFHAEAGRTEIAIRRVRERLVAVFSQVPTTKSIGDDDAVANIQDQIIARAEERLLIVMGGGEGEAAAASSDEESERLWEQLRQRIGMIVAAEYADFSEDLRPLITEYYMQLSYRDFYTAMERKLRGYIDQYRENVRRRPILEREATRLTNEVETNRAIHDAFLESKTSAQITEAAQNTDLGLRISVVERAERPFKPVKPNPIKIILLAILFGSVCGIGAILVTEYVDDSFRSVEEVQLILKLPVLGTIPRTVEQFSWEKKRRGRLVIFWAIGVILFSVVMSGALYVYGKRLQRSSLGIELRLDAQEEER